jgi:tricorn protease
VTALVGDGTSPRITADGKSVIYISQGQILTIDLPETIPSTRRMPFFAQTQLTADEERKRLFDEAWSNLQRGFYDAKMHGVDWNAMRKKYEEVVTGVQTKVESYYWITVMIGELNASHLGIYGNTDGVGSHQSGYLLADIKPETGDDGQTRFRVSNIQKRSGLNNAWVREGDYVFAIDNTTLTPSTNIEQALAGTAGRQIRLKVAAKADGSDARWVQVGTYSQGQIQNAEYVDWVTESSKAVREGTKSKVGYIHLNAMDPANLARFRAAVSSEFKRKKGLIIDVRGNGGGRIHQELMEILTAKPWGKWAPRGGMMTEEPGLYFTEPVVVLIDNNSFSDAEVFPYIFKALNRGKLVGVPTAGGVIGTFDIRLSDGTGFRIPTVGFYGMDGTNLENLGVPPDFYVEIRPEDKEAGRDPQLQKAIEVILGDISGNPVDNKPAEKTVPATTATEEPTATPETPATPDAPEPTGDEGASAAESTPSDEFEGLVRPSIPTGMSMTPEQRVLRQLAAMWWSWM